MKLRTLVPLVLTFGWLTGCQTPPDRQQLENQNAQLEADLARARAQIAALETQEQQLRAQVDELSRVMAVLDTEKTVRVQESSQLRGQVRRYVQNEIDELKDFMMQSNLLDYVGGELVQRSGIDSDPKLLIDLANPMPGTGTLTGVSAYFLKPGTFTVQVLRPVQDELLVIWKSAVLSAEQAGERRINFPVSVGVEQGDVIGYIFHQPGTLSFDQGTGNTLYTDSAPNLGQSVKIRALDGDDEKRAYPVGVYGLLN